MSLKVIANLASTIAVVYAQTCVFLFLKIFVDTDLAAAFVIANAFMAPLYMLGSMNLRMVFLVLEKNNENLLNFQYWKLFCGLIIVCISFFYLEPTSSIVSVFIVIRFIDSLQELNYVYYIKNNLYKINLLLVASKLLLFTFLLFFEYIYGWHFFPLFYLLLTFLFFIIDLFVINFRRDCFKSSFNKHSLLSIVQQNYVLSINSFSNSTISNIPRYLFSTNSNLLNIFHSYTIIPVAVAYLTAAFQDFILIDYNNRGNSVRRRFVRLVLFTLVSNIFSFVLVFFVGKYLFGSINTNPSEFLILIAALSFVLFKQVESLFLGLLFAKNLKFYILIYLVGCVSLFAISTFVLGEHTSLILYGLITVYAVALIATLKVSGLIKKNYFTNFG